MNKKQVLIAFWLLYVFTLAGCLNGPSLNIEKTPTLPQTVVVTRIVTRIIEVTRVVQQPTTIPESGVATAATGPTVTPLPVAVQAGDLSVLIDPAYFDGIIVLTQYYTLLKQGLYEESYPLLSSSQQKIYNFKDYTSFYTSSLKALEIEGIQPYNYWRAQQGFSAWQIPPDELRYVIFMTAFHNGAAWNEGGTPMPDKVTGFQSLVFENNEWKIDEFNTSPWMLKKTSATPQTVEVTRIIEVTQVVQQPTAMPETGGATVAAGPTVTPLPVTVQAGVLSGLIDPAYLDGIIVLTQYYTLLDHGFFEEVIPLYSSSLLKKSRGGNFEDDLKSVTVRFIHPYNYWRAQQGWAPQSIPQNEIRYVVGTIVFHKGAAWNEGGTPRPDEQTRFVSLVLENGKWKLNEFNSSPWFH